MPAVIAAESPSVESSATESKADEGQTAKSPDSSEEKAAEKDDEGKEEKILEIDPAPHGWTVYAVNVDAHELLITFAAKAHLQLIVDDTVKRSLTINIVDKPAREILQVIVDAYGFSWAEVEGVHIISEGMPRTPSSYLLSNIASVTTKYVSPAQARQLFPIFLYEHIKVNTDQNALVLSGPQAVLDKFREDVEQFDVPAAQIMLEPYSAAIRGQITISPAPMLSPTRIAPGPASFQNPSVFSGMSAVFKGGGDAIMAALQIVRNDYSRRTKT